MSTRITRNTEHSVYRAPRGCLAPVMGPSPRPSFSTRAERMYDLLANEILDNGEASISEADFISASRVSLTINRCSSFLEAMCIFHLTLYVAVTQFTIGTFFCEINEHF